MKILVVYDSMFGNTARVAGAIGDALREGADVRVMPVAEAAPNVLAEADLLFVGSPTQRFRPLPSVASLLRGLPRGSLAQVCAAAFDTRLDAANADSVLMRFVVGVLASPAYAARRIERDLCRAGARLAVSGEGFLVDGMEGPLKEGELERAAQWARRVAAKLRAGAVPASTPLAGAERPVGPSRSCAERGNEGASRGRKRAASS